MLTHRRPNALFFLVLGSLLATQPWGLTSWALAQVTPPSLVLINVARYYKGLPHQDRALWLLQQQIDAMDPELLQADSIMANVWRNSDTLVGHVNILEQIPPAKRTGSDPLALAIDNANLNPGAPVDIEMLTGENVESPDQVMVTVTAGGILDDSVAGMRYRFDIQQHDGQWTIGRAGLQFRCQPGRGHQTWSDESCI